MNGVLEILDQRLLPQQERCLTLRTPSEVWDAIHGLAVRGAPAIGIAAAYGFVLGMASFRRKIELRELSDRSHRLADYLRSCRPTAVNLAWALERMERTFARVLKRRNSLSRSMPLLLREARAIHKEDVLSCWRMGERGAKLLPRQVTVLTHCNAGRLATGGLGTALAVIYRAAASGKKIRVYADETRPLLQGARLTCWELRRSGIDTTLLCEGAAASLFQKGKIDAVLVGADRIAANGDVANKVGTYPLAVLARRHGVPFYVVAPRSTFDPSTRRGSEIPIENRAAEEVSAPRGERLAPDGVHVFNPAFDVTPRELVTAIVTEAGILHRPNSQNIQKLLRRKADKG